jgi:hypothetical protein
MRLPIVIIADDQTPSIHDDLTLAEGTLEDYFLDTLVAYDCEGRKLRFEPAPHHGVRIVDAPDGAIRSEELRNLLVDALRRKGEEPTAHATLDEVLARATRY